MAEETNKQTIAENTDQNDIQAFDQEFDRQSDAMRDAIRKEMLANVDKEIADPEKREAMKRQMQQNWAEDDALDKSEQATPTVAQKAPSLPNYDTKTGKKLTPEEAKVAFAEKNGMSYEDAMKSYFSQNAPRLANYNTQTGEKLTPEQAKEAFAEKNGISYDDAIKSYFSQHAPRLANYNTKTGEKLTPEQSAANFEAKYHIPYERASSFFKEANPEQSAGKEASTEKSQEARVSADKFKEAATAYASQGGAEKNKANKAAFYAEFDGFVKESLAAGKTPDEIKQDLSRTLNEIRSDGLADDNKFGDGKITTMQNWADKAMDRVGRYYDAVNGSGEQTNEPGTKTPLEQFKESAATYASETGGENNKKNKEDFYASLDALMQDSLSKGMTPQEVTATLNNTLDEVYNEALAAGNTPAAKKVPTMVSWANKAADQVAGYYDVMKKKEGNENMAENVQDAENTANFVQIPEHAESLQQEETQDLHPVRVEPTAEQEATQDLHPVRVEPTAEQEATQDLHPVPLGQTAEMVAVRENEMPEKAQEPLELHGKEADVLQAFGEAAQKPTKESLEEFMVNLRDLVGEYEASGMSFPEATQKASAFLDQLYDRAESQNLDSQLLSNLKNLKDAANKFMAQAAESSNAGPMMLNEVNPEYQDENVQDVDYEDVPTKPEAENEGQEEPEPQAPTNENEGQEEPAPQAPTNENDGQEEPEPQAPTNENEGQEEPEPQAPTNENEGQEEPAPQAPTNENDGQEEPEPQAPTNENEGQAPAGRTGSFGVVVDGPEDVNTPTPTPDPTRTSDLKQQLLNTAFKNRYTLVEDNYDDPSRKCPFSQLKVRTLEDNSGDEKNPYVKMELESGNRIYNRPNQVDVHYDTYVKKDGTREPQISFEDCMAAVRLGMEKGWTAATLEGPEEYKQQMYLAMRAMGMKVIGYTPSKELEAEGDALAEKHAIDRNHAESIDERFDKLESARKKAKIKEPDEIGKEFVESMREQGLGYRALDHMQDKEPEQRTPTAENDGKDEQAPETPTAENDGKDEQAPETPTAENDGKDEQPPETPTAENDGKDEQAPETPTAENDGKDEQAPETPTAENDGKDEPAPSTPLLLPEKAESLQQQPQEQTAANEGQTAEAASQTPLLLPEKAESLQQQPQEQTQQAQQEPQKPMLALPPHIEENLNKETQEATTALAVYDPAKAQEAKSQIAATPGIADRLQITGKTADAAQGNAVKAAQQQRHQQEAALVVANTQGKGGR